MAHSKRFVVRGGGSVVGVVALAVLLNGLVPSGAGATHQPADKVVAAGSKIKSFAPGENVELLRATLRTSSPTDLILAVSMECSILTRLVTNNSNPDASAQGKIRSWVEIDGKIVPVNGFSSPGQVGLTPENTGNDSDKVTFCNRVYQRSVTDQEDPLDGIDETRDYIDTKSANAFNWLRLNLGNGVHTIVVKGELSASATGDGSLAEAYVGNRSLIVQPAKLANDAAV